MPDPQVTIVRPPQTLAAAAAQRMVALAATEIQERGRFSVALSGGSTPQAMFRLLASPQYRDAIPWDKLFVFWGDERFVPPDDEESNYRMARETLLDHVPLPAANIFPVPTVGSTPEAAAQAYADTIMAFFGDETPRFGLILLGMGPDGHTASLFPGHPEPGAPGDALVIAVHNSPKPPPDRLSFTYRLINAAHHVLFLVGGADKAATVRQVLAGPRRVADLPAQGVQPDGTLEWLLDEAAAQELDRS
jgi:6-phosphogluconolactonase